VARGAQAVFGERAIIKLQNKAPWKSTKGASIPDLPNTTQGAKATAKDIENAVLLVSIQPAAVGCFSDLFLHDG
jgi:hypothetical protein